MWARSTSREVFLSAIALLETCSTLRTRNVSQTTRLVYS
jgi:hypothetical protein